MLQILQFANCNFTKWQIKKKPKLQFPFHFVQNTWPCTLDSIDFLFSLLFAHLNWFTLNSTDFKLSLLFDHFISFKMCDHAFLSNPSRTIRRHFADKNVLYSKAQCYTCFASIDILPRKFKWFNSCIAEAWYFWNHF